MNVILAFLLQLLAYLGLLLLNEYAGTLLAAILVSIAFLTWLLSLIVEWIEPSRVPRSFYRYTLTAWLAPAVALAAYVALRGKIEWLTL